MATTTLRIEDELKARVTAAAERAGKSPHAFMLEAIAQRNHMTKTLRKPKHLRDEIEVSVS